MPSLTDTLLVWAVDMYAGNIWDDVPIEDQICGETIKMILELEAHQYLLGELEDEDAEDGELFPSWVTLVVTPGIKKNIDWEEIAQRTLDTFLAL